MLKTTGDARQYFKAKGLDYKHLTRGNLQELRRKINACMISSRCIKGTFRCKQRPEFRPDYFWAGIKCRSFYFNDREAVSFNPDGFIGFAGWADSTNIRPILDGFEQWVDWMVNN